MHHRLADALERWAAAGLVTDEQAGRIREFESGSVRRESNPEPRVRRDMTSSEHRRALIAEAVGSLGAIAAAAAAVVGTAVLWPDLTSVARVTIPTGGAIVLLAAGAAVHRSADASIRRLASLLWLLGVAALAATVAIVSDDLLDLAAQNVAVSTGSVALVVGAVLLALLPSPHLVLASVGAAACLAVGLVLQYDSAQPAHVGAVLLCLGVAVSLLGWARIPSESATTTLAGAAVALVGAEMLGELERHWPIVAGGSVALCLLVLFVESRDRASLVAGLVIAVVVAVQGIVQLSRNGQGGGDTNRWVILMVFVVGALVLGASLAAVRSSARTRGPV